MSTFAIKSNHIVLPNHVDGSGHVLVKDGVIAGVVEEAPQGVEVIDHSDCWVAPGFVDTHIHGFVGRDVMDLDPAGITVICEELARRGTTSWLATTLTASVEQTGQACASVAAAVAAQGDDFVGCRTQGIFLEGPFFTEEHKGAQNPKYLIDPKVEILDGWQEQAGGLIVKSALAPEREGTLDYVRAMGERGVTVALGHTSATYDECLAAVEAGARVFVHTYNGMADLLHREPGPVGCAMTTPDTYSELICDGMHVHPAACAALVNAKGWEHVALITRQPGWLHTHACQGRAQRGAVGDGERVAGPAHGVRDSRTQHGHRRPLRPHCGGTSRGPRGDGRGPQSGRDLCGWPHSPLVQGLQVPARGQLRDTPFFAPRGKEGRVT